MREEGIVGGRERKESRRNGDSERRKEREQGQLEEEGESWIEMGGG